MLGAYMEAAAARPVAWAVHDCMTLPADWWLLNTGEDPGAVFRGRYRTRLGAQRLITRAGGLLNLWREAARGVRCAEVSAPETGDVGVAAVLTPDGPAQAGAIRIGRSWAALTPSGLLVGPAETLAAWRF